MVLFQKLYSSITVLVFAKSFCKRAPQRSLPGAVHYAGLKLGKEVLPIAGELGSALPRLMLQQLEYSILIR